MKNLLTLIFLLVSYCSFSQNIQGKIISNDSLPIESARINYKNKTAISNSDGLFPISDINIGDTIIVSAPGYDTKIISVTKENLHETLVIVLSSNTNELPSVTIKSESAKDYLYRAIAISDALVPNDVTYNGYYREYMKFSSEIKKYADGDMDIYLSNNKTMVAVNASRVIDGLSEDDNSFDKVYRSQYKIHWLTDDFYPSSGSRSFQKENSDKYIFKYKSRTDSFTIIELTPNATKNKESFTQIDVYINVQDSTIRDIIGSIVPSKKGTIVKKNIISTFSPIDVRIIIHYNLEYGKLVFNYIKKDTHGTIKLFKKEHDVETISELFVGKKVNTKITTDYKNDYLYKNGTHFTEPFWEKMENVNQNTQDVISFLKTHQ